MGHEGFAGRWLSDHLTHAGTSATSSTTVAITSGVHTGGDPSVGAVRRDVVSSCLRWYRLACTRPVHFGGQRLRRQWPGIHDVSAQRRAQRVADVGGVVGWADRPVGPALIPFVIQAAVFGWPGPGPSATSGTTVCCGRKSCQLGRYDAAPGARLELRPARHQLCSSTCSDTAVTPASPLSNTAERQVRPACRGDK